MGRANRESVLGHAAQTAANCSNLGPNDLQHKMDPDACMRRKGAGGRRSSCSGKLSRMPSLAESTDEDEGSSDEQAPTLREKTRRMSWSSGSQHLGQPRSRSNSLEMQGGLPSRTHMLHRRRSSLNRVESALPASQDSVFDPRKAP